MFFSKAGLSAPIQKGTWTFSEAKDAYVGVCVVEGRTSFQQGRFGCWLVCGEKMTPVIIEAGRKSDYADFASFQNRAMRQALSFEKGILSYQTLAGDQMTFYADHSRLPEVNGVAVNLAPDLVFDSPFVESKWDSGVVTIKYENSQRTLNFNHR